MNKIEYIKPVKDNKSKGFTYAMLNGRLSQSIREEYYLEAMVLEYAIFEDQFSEMLKMLGLVHIKDNKLTSRNCYAEAISSITGNNYEKNKVVTFANITTKYKVHLAS